MGQGYSPDTYFKSQQYDDLGSPDKDFMQPARSQMSQSVVQPPTDEQNQEFKQQFLKDEILNKGYDPNEFANFLLENYFTQDINHFEFHQLQTAVGEFQSRFQPVQVNVPAAPRNKTAQGFRS
jgi:hypothetical protein